MKNKSLLTAGAIMVALVAVISLSVASYAAEENEIASPNQPDRPFMKEGFDPGNWQEQKNQMRAKQQAVIAALEAQDYQAWQEAVGVDSPMAQEITEDEFPRLLEAHQLMQEAQSKIEQAQQIKEELGLKSFAPGKRNWRGMGHGFMKNFPPETN